MSRHFLITGSGSVGKRHATNLVALGHTVSCVDPREDRRAELAGKVPLRGSFASREEALAAERFDGVVVCTPTAFHGADTLAAIEAGIPVLLEKPAAGTLEEVRRMRAAAKAVPVLLGYTWRWWPALRRARAVLRDGGIGRVLFAQFHMSAHLADWHPWERYQDFFMAKAALGGGALLDESHWIDLMVWFFGLPKMLTGRVEKISNLDIDSDDNVDILAIYENGLRVSLHLDLYGRPHEKSIRFVGESGTLMWSADPNRIAIATGAAQDWQEELFQGERNDMFVAVAREFLDMLDGKAGPSCTLDDGMRVLQVIEAVRESTGSGRSIALGLAA
jgi:predicted dehydrogenase